MKLKRAKEVEQARWDTLRKRYRERGLVLILGAGVSKGCLIPDWEELILRMGEGCLPKGREIVGRMISNGHSLPAVAGLLDSLRGPLSHRTDATHPHKGHVTGR